MDRRPSGKMGLQRGRTTQSTNMGNDRADADAVGQLRTYVDDLTYGRYGTHNFTSTYDNLSSRDTTA